MKTCKIMRTLGRTNENNVLSFQPPEKVWVEETRRHLSHYLRRWPHIYLHTFCFPGDNWSLPPCHIGNLELHITSLGKAINSVSSIQIFSLPQD